ncbi:MAG: thiamine pyrophosphate-binding protein [Dehalococcoidia bacterium]
MSNSKTITGAELISQSLKTEGVENIFTLAGDHILPALDSIHDDGFNIYDTRHEQAATHMADAWGRITGNLGVSIYTTPGFANAIPGIANAFHSESPLLSISGSAELDELGRGAMQEINQVEMAQPITKGSWMVTDPRRIPDMISNAIRVAFDGRRGPVHLTIPVDIQQMAIPKEDVTFYTPSQYRAPRTMLASKQQIEKTIALMKNAKRPLIILGSAAAYSNKGTEIEKLIETIKFPIMTEGDARGLIADNHTYSRGFFDSALNMAARKIKEADLVILMGRKQDVIIGYALEPTISKKASLIQIDPEGSAIGRNRGVDIGIVGDISEIASQLTNEASKHSWDNSDWLSILSDEQTKQKKSLEESSESSTPMHASYVHKTVAKHLNPDDILVFDGGDFCHYGRAYHEANTPKSYWYLPPSGMLGQALPTAMAAKIAFPDRRVIMFTGDGSFGFNGMEYDTAVRHNLPIMGILGNDSTWGIDKHIQVNVFGKAVATDLLPSRYDQIVKALGGHGELIEYPADLSEAIERGFKLNKPTLLNVEIQNIISPRGQAASNKWTSRTLDPL